MMTAIARAKVPTVALFVSSATNLLAFRHPNFPVDRPRE
jgi:hypothetical protein